MYQAEWKPAPAAVFQDRSASPSVLDRATQAAAGTLREPTGAAPSPSSRAASDPFRRASFGLHSATPEAMACGSWMDDEVGAIAPRGEGTEADGEPDFVPLPGVPFGQTNGNGRLSKSQLRRRKAAAKKAAARLAA